jgi:hypothetical protein
MKKIIFFLSLSVIIMLVMLSAALFYIDLTGHKGYLYELRINDISCGSMRLEKYVTENKIIYKADIDKTNTLDYPKIIENLHIDKDSGDTVKLEKEFVGCYGERARQFFFRENNSKYYVYLDYPEFINIDGGYINKAVTLFNPEDPFSCVAMIEKYSLWRKGKQFFDVIIAPQAPIAPFAQTLEIFFSGDEYVQVLGKKVPAEIYVISGQDLPDIRIAISKFYHEVLFIENTISGNKMRLISIIESPFERLKEKFYSLSGRLKPANGTGTAIESSESYANYDPGTTAENLSGKIKQEKIFINKGTKVVSGYLFSPEDKKEAKAKIVIMPSDGPVPGGENIMVHALSEYLAEKGFLPVMLTSYMDSNMRTSFYMLDDNAKKEYIDIFLDYLASSKYGDSPVLFLGYKGGGFICLAGSFERSGIAGYIQMGLPALSWKKIPDRAIDNYIKEMYAQSGIKLRHNENVEFIREYTLQYLNDIFDSEQDVLSCKRINLPLREYREYLRRDYSILASKTDIPLFFIYSKKEKESFSDSVNDMREIIDSKKKLSVSEEIQKSGKFFLDPAKNNILKNYKINEVLLEQMEKWIRDVLIFYEKETQGQTTFQG